MDIGQKGLFCKESEGEAKVQSLRVQKDMT